LISSSVVASSSLARSQHDAMRRYEEQQARLCNEIATEVGKRDIQQPSSAVADQEMLSKDTERRSPTIM